MSLCRARRGGNLGQVGLGGGQQGWGCCFAQPGPARQEGPRGFWPHTDRQSGSRSWGGPRRVLLQQPRGRASVCAQLVQRGAGRPLSSPLHTATGAPFLSPATSPVGQERPLCSAPTPGEALLPVCVEGGASAHWALRCPLPSPSRQAPLAGQGQTRQPGPRGPPGQDRPRETPACCDPGNGGWAGAHQEEPHWPASWPALCSPATGLGPSHP